MRQKNRGHEILGKSQHQKDNSRFLIKRITEVHLFYNLQLSYWHFIEILWLFIFLVLYFG